MSVACAVLGIVTYGPAIFGDYGRLDDYGYVFASRTGTLDGTRTFLLDSGRPVAAVVMTVVAPPVHTIEGLWLFRLASTIVLALGAATVALLTLRLVDRPWRGSALVLAVCTGGVALSTTSTPSSATWAIIVGGVVAFPAAMAAGLWATTSRPRWWILSGALVLVAVFSYQQVAPIAVLPTMLWSAHRWARREPAMWSRTVVVAAVTIAGLLANLWMVRERSSIAMERITDATMAERQEWFIHAFLPRTVDLQLLGTHESLMWSIALLAVLLLFPALTGIRFLAGSVAVLLTWAGVALVVFPLELWASFRLAAASQFVLWAGAAVVFSAAVLRISQPKVRAVLVTAAVGGTIVSLAVAGMRAENYLAEPNELDWASVQCGVTTGKALEPGADVQLNYWDAYGSDVVSMDEYGIVASGVGWAAQYAVWLAAAEAAGNGEPAFQPNELTFLPPGPTTPGAWPIPSTGGC